MRARQTLIRLARQTPVEQARFSASGRVVLLPRNAPNPYFPGAIPYHVRAGTCPNINCSPIFRLRAS